MRKAMSPRFALVVVPLTVALLATSPASAAVWDRNDTAGPLDIRWVNIKQALRRTPEAHDQLLAWLPSKCPGWRLSTWAAGAVPLPPVG